ncbi:unnamed protein product [Polarella glacialis]|uniref:Aminotransferase class I/classII large domain-containing protein n=1 Tax=Polarella glacialis TaxID=89957 RepID=A0A813ER17_POLGL|nr:unnamed protein product [Polarella glacialis]
MASSGKRLIDLRKGYPKSRNLPHTRLAEACRLSAARLDSASEEAFPLQYSSGLGTARFNERLAEFLRREYKSAVFADVVIMEEPSYFLAHKIFLDHGLRVLGAAIDEHGLDTDALAARFASGELASLQPKLLYLVPSHGNPSGATLPLRRRQHLVKLAEKHGFTVLCDDVYHLLDWSSSAKPLPRLLEFDSAFQGRASASAGRAQDVPKMDEDASYTIPKDAASDGKALSSLKEGHVVSIGSFTKILAPGLRLGWIEASGQLLSRIAKRGYIQSGGSVAPFASEIVSELLESGGQSEVLAQLRNDYSASQRAMCTALRAHPDCFSFEEPAGGFFIWCRLPEGVTTTGLLPIAERHGVVFLPGPMSAPGAPKERFESHLRLCFAYEEADAICEGVERLAAAVAEAHQELRPQKRVKTHEDDLYNAAIFRGKCHLSYPRKKKISIEVEKVTPEVSETASPTEQALGGAENKDSVVKGQSARRVVLTKFGRLPTTYDQNDPQVLKLLPSQWVPDIGLPLASGIGRGFFKRLKTGFKKGWRRQYVRPRFETWDVNDVPQFLLDCARQQGAEQAALVASSVGDTLARDVGWTVGSVVGAAWGLTRCLLGRSEDTAPDKGRVVVAGGYLESDKELLALEDYMREASQD